jgi:hypothetical protein
MGNAYHDVIAALLIGMLFVVLILGVFFSYLILRWRHVRRLNIIPGPHSYIRVFNRPPRPNLSGLNRPTSWLAIRNVDLQSVQMALSLRDPEPCPLSRGLNTLNEQKLFISPPISGWVLVIGPSLPDPTEDVDLCFRFLTNLSRKLGHVQYFKINSVLNHHSWVKVEFGSVVRGYAWSGKTLWNQGSPTREEQELGLRCYEYCESPAFSLFESGDDAHTNSEKIHQLAARWSINPESIDERFLAQRIGIVGHPAKLV